MVNGNEEPEKIERNAGASGQETEETEESSA